MRRQIVYCLTFLLSFSLLYGQDFRRDERQDSTPLEMDFSPTSEKISERLSLTVSVNESEYKVDAGDVFMIKVDVPGPAIRIFPATVTSDGRIMLPDAPSVEVKQLYLVDAKNKILDALKDKNPNALIEVFLSQVHPISITVLGAVERNGRQQLVSTSRLYEAVQTALAIPEPLNRSSTKARNQGNIEEEEEIEPWSLRRVEVLRDGEKHVFDLMRFERLGKLEHNPYLMDNDVIIVPFKGEKTHSLTVSGAVGEEIEYEFLPGDKLKDALDFAGGLLPTADSTKIEIYRFARELNSLKTLVVDCSSNNDMPLMPDDRIYVRYKANYHQKFYVEVRGEVNYPGTYAIEEGTTMLSEIIKRAGGFSENALLENAKIIRQKILLEDKELDRLRRMAVEEMNDLEKSYFRLRSREDIRLVACDFEKLFLQNVTTEDIVLRDQDIINIPRENKIVFVSGGVIAPGNVNYDANYTYKNYIDAAGGFNRRAQKGNVKIIKSKTGVWLDAEGSVHIEEGDIVFVPEKKQRDWWEMFKEGLTVATQFATIIVVITKL